MDKFPKRHEELFSSMPMGIVVTNAAGALLYVNPFVTRLFQVEEAEILEDRFYQVLFASEEAAKRFRDKTLTALKEPFDDLDMNMQNKSGDPIAVHVTGYVLQEGQEIALVIQDVTNRKAYEKVIESSFDNFIQTTLDLDSALKKIKEQNQILDDYKIKMTRELSIAMSVQKAIIPKVFPRRPNFDVYGLSIPSEELGGDYFDFFVLDEHLIGILIADVSGHGVPSALITTMVKANFEYYTKRFWEPEKVLESVNRDVSLVLEGTGFYLTAIYGVLDLQSLRLSLSTAGHDYGISVTRDKPGALKLGEGAEGTILGIFPDAQYQSQFFQLEPDTKVIFYTDGITEARSDQGEFYGPERLQAFLQKQIGRGSRESVETLIEEIDAFYGTSHPNDDRTVVIFDILGHHQEGPQSAQDHVKSGKKLLLEKNFTKALYEFQKAIQTGVEQSEPYYLAGQCCSFLGQYNEAAEYLDQAIVLEPGSYKSHYYMGIVRHNMKQYAKAREHWLRVLDINGNYKDCRKLLENLEKKLST